MRLNGRLTAMKISEGNVLQPKVNYCKFKKIKVIGYLFDTVEIFLKKMRKKLIGIKIFVLLQPHLKGRFLN